MRKFSTLWSLSEAIAAAGGDLHGADCALTSVGTDSRVDCSGQLFIALRGEHFDGHDHVAAAQAAGAVAALVDHPLPLELPQWVVDDTRLGLGRLAAAWRQRVAGRVIALTGSNGKTTVKDMLAAILAQVGTVRATRGNLNNDIGMPLTLLAVRDEEFVVLEMGANHPGEIAYLSAIAQPELALITNVGHAHLEGFGSLDGVAAAKGEIAGGLTADGVLVVDGASPYLELWRELAAGRQVLTFQHSAESAPLTLWNETGFCTEWIAPLVGEPLRLTLHLAGAHNLHNALAAATVARALGIADAAIQAGLASVRPVAGRLCPRWGVAPNGERFGIIDDTYNANPDSLAAALELLAQLDGRRWLICGDLAELGADTARLHAEVGNKARAVGIERLVTVGTLSAHASAAFGDDARHFVDQQQLLAWLMPQLNATDRVLVKGSRSARMERIVNALCAEVGV